MHRQTLRRQGCSGTSQRMQIEVQLIHCLSFGTWTCITLQVVTAKHSTSHQPKACGAAKSRVTSALSGTSGERSGRYKIEDDASASCLQSTISITPHKQRSSPASPQSHCGPANLFAQASRDGPLQCQRYGSAESH